MKSQRLFVKSALFASVSAALMFIAMPASAHCDGLDGPVVKAAQQALETGDVNRVLIWVQPDDDAEIRHAFRKAQEVRKLNDTAREFADTAFYETLVRVHRAGEGEAYTGLKPAGRDLGAAIPAGDKAIATGSVVPVVKLLTEGVHDGVEHRYKQVMARKNFKADDVAAGRKYVEAYVGYIHAVEKVHQAVAGDAHGHAALKAAEHAAHGQKRAEVASQGHKH
jgi:hypothetical protein